MGWQVLSTHNFVWAPDNGGHFSLRKNSLHDNSQRRDASFSTDNVETGFLTDDFSRFRGPFVTIRNNNVRQPDTTGKKSFLFILREPLLRKEGSGERLRESCEGPETRGFRGTRKMCTCI